MVGNLLYGATNASSLATVVAGQMTAESLSTMFFKGREYNDVNNCIQTGIYQTGIDIANSPANWCLILVLTNPEMNSTVQLAVKIYDAAKVFVRARESSTMNFTEWVPLV